MSFEITTAQTRQYSDNIMMLLQQEGSRLRNTVRNETQIGEKQFWEQIGATVAKKKTSRHGDSPLISTPHSRRMNTTEDFEWGDMIDKADENKMIINPASKYVTNAVNSFGRAMDQTIIAAAIGTSSTGKEGTTGVVLPATQIFATTVLDLAALITADSIFTTNEVSDTEEKFIIIGPKQRAALLGINQLTSADYNTNKTLVNGKIGSFMGFTFIVSNYLPKVAGVRQCIAYTKSGILLGLGQDIQTEMSKRPDKSYSWYAYASMSIGATRMEEGRVIRIDVTEA